jgi:hypothetical protein
MSILAVLRLTPGVDTGRVAAHLDSEVRTLWHLYTEGVVTQAHLTDDPATVVLLLDTQDSAQARTALDALPLVSHGLMTAELHTLVPFRNWQRLFAADHG